MRQMNSTSTGVPTVKAAPGRRPTVDPAPRLPLCCQAWIGETAHAWHRRQDTSPRRQGGAHGPAKSGD